MQSKAQSISKYFIINGWLIALLVCVLILMHVLGVADFMKGASETCELGDGFTCISQLAETNDVKFPSEGDSGDKVTIFLHNDLSETAYNLSIMIKECEQKDLPLAMVESGKNLSYEIKRCKNIPPGKSFNSVLELRYSTSINNQVFNHMNKGFINSYVTSPAPVGLLSKISNGITNWIRTNVG